MALEVLGMMPGKKIIVTPGMIELADKEFELNMEFGKNIADVCDEVILVGETKTKAIYEGLKDDVTELSIVSDEGATYTTDTLVVPATISKGLEFDSVIIIDKEDFNKDSILDMKLLYVSMTRALHKLYIKEDSWK